MAPDPRPRPAGTTTTPDLRWAAYAAAAVAFLFAVPSVYWGLGGTVGLDTLGGAIEERALARDAALMVANWVAVVLKIGGGVLALTLVRPWGRRLPFRLLRGVSATAAVLLVLYGTLQTVSVLVVHLGVIEPAAPVEPSVLLWRLLLWEPWFLVWGLLLGLAMIGANRRRRVTPT